MGSDVCLLHHRTTVQLAAEPQRLFAHLDNHRRLAGHMEKPSVMTAGATMRIDMDGGNGQAVGSSIRISQGLAYPAAASRRMSKRVAPESDRTEIVPPWATTIDLVIARPSPTPSPSRLRDGSTR